MISSGLRITVFLLIATRGVDGCGDTPTSSVQSAPNLNQAFDSFDQDPVRPF